MGTSAYAERRGAPRRQFEGTVELAQPDQGDPYEADAVDLSINGMALRTAYLPDVGSELECSFALETGHSVNARGEVVWARNQSTNAGEGAFGLRFTGMSPEDMRAIHHSIPESEPPMRASAPSGAELRARLHLPDMDSPLKARIRGGDGTSIVLSSDLSFLRVGDAVEVERHDGRMPGALRGVSIEIDPKSLVARLVLTVDTGAAGADSMGAPIALGPTPELAPREHAVAAAPVYEPAPVPTAPSRARTKSEGGIRAEHDPALSPALAVTLDAHKVEALSRGEPRDERPHEPVAAAEPAAKRSTRPRMPTEVLAEAPARVIEPAPSLARGGESLHPSSHDEGDALHDEGDALESTEGASRAPAWLVGLMATLRSIATAAAPRLRAALAAVAAAVQTFVQTARAKLTGRGEEPAHDQAMVAPTGPRRPVLRKQLPDARASNSEGAGATDSMARTTRRRYGLYGLAGFGVLAIGVALVTGGREAPSRPPRPRTAVASAAGANEAAAATPSASAIDPNASADPLANASASSAPAGGPSELEAMPNAPIAPAAPAAAMPTDLVAAARSRNADVASGASVVRAAAPRPAAAPTRASTPAPAAARTPPAAAATARVLGNPTVRTGTTLRLRMDGAIANLAGGASAGNAIVLRIAGRHSVDMAAPLVRLDSRLVNASVYNRAAGAELTLRFRENVPAFSARAAGNTLEITLAPPARGAHPATPTRAAHAR